MKIINYEIKKELYSANAFNSYFKDMKIGVLDIETTGLNPNINEFILGGIYDFNNQVLYQALAENRNEEAELLEVYLDKFNEFDMFITYNGRHFDLPFLQKRAKLLLNQNIPKVFNFDLYLLLNAYSPLRSMLPNLKQKTIENYMGLWSMRLDEISGKESIDLYYEYESTGSSELESKILLHNNDDLLQLADIIKVVEKTDFHRGMYTLGFPIGTLNVESISISAKHLYVKGTQRNIKVNYQGYTYENQPMGINFNKRDASFEFDFPLLRKSGIAYIDIKPLGFESSIFKNYPYYYNDFLILSNKNELNHMAVNHFIREFIRKFLTTL